MQLPEFETRALKEDQIGLASTPLWKTTYVCGDRDFMDSLSCP